MKKILTSLLLINLFLSPIVAQETITINPEVRHQTLDGWGGSLSWWANICGGHSDAKTNLLANWITDPKQLNMNIFRFNIGAGDHPDHAHMRQDGGDMPGYKASADANYDWTQDENQRQILQKIIATRKQKLQGELDIKLVAFSTSPPWWMTYSGCSAGAETKSTNNLREDMYDDFADYLTEVVKYYHDSLGITFDYLEPFNEPDGGWWVAQGNQEGCYFTVESQKVLIREVYAALARKDMLSYCKLAGSDWNSIGKGVTALRSYVAAGDIMDKLGHIDCHSYFGTDNDRKAIAQIAQDNSHTLWQSESGPLNVGNSAQYQIMHIAQRIITDMRLMKPQAWIDWQIVADGSIQWGLVDGKYSQPTSSYQKNISFAIRSQYSRFLKKGYHIIASSRWNTLAAISPSEDEIVCVITNTEENAKEFIFDLSNITLADANAFKFVTTIDGTKQVSPSIAEIVDHTIKYTAPAQSTTTFVIPIDGFTIAPSTTLANFEDINHFTSIGFHPSFKGTYPNDTAKHDTWHILFDSITSNPNTSINSTENTFLVRQENSDWLGNFLNFRLADTGKGISINASNRFLHVFHLRSTIEDGWSIYLNNETYYDNEQTGSLRFNGNNQKADVWQDLVFDLNKLIIKGESLDLFTFCLNTDYAAPKIHPMSNFAFDEIALNSNPTPRTTTSGFENQNTTSYTFELEYRYTNSHLKIFSTTTAPLDNVFLYDLQGRTIYSNATPTYSHTIPQVKAGIYILKGQQTGMHSTQKIALY